MKTFEYIADLTTFLSDCMDKGFSVGFVPTMGALHEGHFSLMKSSLTDNDISIVSIFVNPIQFNDREDLKNYPRDLQKDLAGLKKLNMDAAFIPDEKEMYPEPDHSFFDFGELDKIMEGKHREGHFRGVAVVVKKLLEIVQPDKVYFGEKDFQQLAIIKELVRQLGMPVQIIACPTIREKDGLAMSSRNQLLTAEQRKYAANISKVLMQSAQMAGAWTVARMKEWVMAQIQGTPMMELEYFEIVHDTNLQPIDNWQEHQDTHGCIAVKVGGIRLIDNIKYNL